MTIWLGHGLWVGSLEQVDLRSEVHRTTDTWSMGAIVPWRRVPTVARAPYLAIASLTVVILSI